MKSSINKYIQLVLLLCFLLLISSCSGSSLEESQVVGDYGVFYCMSQNEVEIKGDGGRYVSMYWEITDPVEHRVEFSVFVTDENIENYQEDFWEELEGIEVAEEYILDNLSELEDMYEIPPEGTYIYNTNENKLTNEDFDSIEYYKQD